MSTSTPSSTEHGAVNADACPSGCRGSTGGNIDSSVSSSGARHANTHAADACALSPERLVAARTSSGAIIHATSAAAALLLPRQRRSLSFARSQSMSASSIAPLSPSALIGKDIRALIGPVLASCDALTIHALESSADGAAASNVVVACRHRLSKQDSHALLSTHSPAAVYDHESDDLVDVWLLDDVSEPRRVFSRIREALPPSSQNVWACLAPEFASFATSADPSIRSRSSSVPRPSPSRFGTTTPSRSGSSAPNPTHMSASADSSFLAKADLLIVAAEQSIISAAGIIGLSSVPRWLFSRIRQYTAPLKFHPMSEKFAPGALEKVSGAVSPSAVWSPGSPPQLVIAMNAYGRIQSVFPIARYLGNTTYGLLNRFVMRFVFVEDVAALCAGLAEASRNGSAEFYVRWDWRSLCESMDDSDGEGDDGSGTSSPSSRSRSVSSSPAAASSPSFSSAQASNSDILDLEVDDPTISEYQSHQPTRRASLIGARLPPLSKTSSSANLPAFFVGAGVSNGPSGTHSPSSPEDLDNSSFANNCDMPAQAQEDVRKLVWVRIIAYRPLVSSPQIPRSDSEDTAPSSGLVCVVTAVPSAASPHNWPSADDVSDSTIGRAATMSNDHQAGPWRRCFDDVLRRPRGVGTSSIGPNTAAASAVARVRTSGVVERFAVRVLGSLLRYALKLRDLERPPPMRLPLPSAESRNPDSSAGRILRVADVGPSEWSLARAWASAWGARPPE
ncbi:hypothetical protein HDU83_002583 [Entophlyctis luteolus]|nr:hypothetical protein HDU83_002583 [Entophlyctis luteolus]